MAASKGRIPLFTTLCVLLAFALAPLAQAVDCLMSHEVAGEMHHSRMAPHHGKMAVADCFSGMLQAVAPDAGPVAKGSMAALVEAPYVPQVAMRVAEAGREVRPFWRGPPPDDVLMVSARRRI